jgi:acetyl esterase/lipase
MKLYSQAFLLAISIIPNIPAAIAQEGKVIPLWKDGAPGYEHKKDEPENEKNGTVTNVHYPTLTAFRPEKGKGNGVAIVIAPGGGLRQLGMRGEGYAMANILASNGYTAFVLKYRLSREAGVPYKFEREVLQDGQRGMRVARSLAEEYGFDPNKVGMMGFSAGGEVVSITSYRSGKGDPNAADPVDRLEARPNFQILIYPGPMGIPSRLPTDAPKAFMLIAADDGHASVLLNLAQRFRESGIGYEAHLYAKGGHGFGMGQRSKRTSIQHWTDRLLDWLNDEVLNDVPK